jgi:hypothetical protein
VAPTTKNEKVNQVQPTSGTDRYSRAREGLGGRVRRALRAGGSRRVGKRTIVFLGNKSKSVITPIVRRHYERQTFGFEELELPYFVAAHNATWSNERALEIAIAQELMSQFDPSSVLEVGAVTRHYLPPHLRPSVTVDKYERSDDVVASDLFDFVSSEAKGFELILAISTLEHFGIDEHDFPEQPQRALEAIRYLQDVLLSPSGRAVITVPLGYNASIDQLVSGLLDMPGVAVSHLYRRSGRFGGWNLSSERQPEEWTYGEEYPTTNAVAVIEAVPVGGEDDEERSDSVADG